MLLKGAYCVGEHFVDPQCTIQGIFEDIYFLIASILSYLIQLVGTLALGALSFLRYLYVICKFRL